MQEQQRKQNNILKKFKTPGEHAFTIDGPFGQIEGVLTVPDGFRVQYMAFLGHPHSLQGGTMNNKVVTTLARAFKDCGISSIRFNFRGVGESAGVFDQGFGESEDMLFLARLCLEELPGVCCLFAGFSFGSYVAYRAAAQFEHGLLMGIAPPVHHFDYEAFSPPPSPWFIVQGDEDEIVPLPLVLDFVAKHKGISLKRFPKTGHFFHGQLIKLKECLIDIIRGHCS